MGEEAAKAFFEKLDKLPSGDRAAIKREAGTMLEQAGGRAMKVFYQCLPFSVPQWQEGCWFAAACLHCMSAPDVVGRISMEQALYMLAHDDATSESIKCRLEGLLDLKWDGYGYMLTKLTRIVKLMCSRGLNIDCAQLLRDLIYWNADNQSVQHKWARAMFAKLDDDAAGKKGE